METLVLKLLAAIAVLATLRDDPEVAALREDVKTLIAKLNASLPAKADGTPWTSEDITAAALAADAPWALVEGRTQGPS